MRAGRRRRGDPQPTAPAAVLLASIGPAFSAEAVRRAAELAAGDAVAVLSIVRIHGSSFGLPNPGLMPTKAERREALDVVGAAVDELDGAGVEVDGQVAATRKPERMVARVAAFRGVRNVVMDAPTSTGFRRLVEGDPAKVVQRRLGDDVRVESIGAPAPGEGPAQNNVR